MELHHQAHPYLLPPSLPQDIYQPTPPGQKILTRSWMYRRYTHDRESTTVTWSPGQGEISLIVHGLAHQSFSNTALISWSPSVTKTRRSRVLFNQAGINVNSPESNLFELSLFFYYHFSFYESLFLNFHVWVLSLVQHVGLINQCVHE